MDASKLPVIFLAFANDKQRRSQYLESVTKEKNAIEKALSYAKGKLCEVLIEPDISIGKIWEVFQSDTYRDRICIFHFGGHADGFQLLLESWDGKHEIAFGEGLVSFLSKQKSLQLIFLNGCSTKELVLELTNKGIPAAIGTTQSIYDSLAAELAPSFYSALGQGVPLQRAWLEATDQLNTKDKKTDKDTSRAGRVLTYENNNEWFLRFHDGAEQAKFWNLPDAAKNPLFGLELPKKYLWPLPLDPYKGLERFQKSDAGIFYGRGAEIRQLFESIKGGYPVILFFGESGVGKSSLLEAGLLPRIEEYYNIIYTRRNEELGLANILNQALQEASNVYGNLEENSEVDHGKNIKEVTEELGALASKAQSKEVQALMDELLKKYVEKEKSEKSSSLLQTWFSLENDIEPRKPLILILDQVEEVFTRPIKGKGKYGELQELCQEIKDLFVNSDKLQGKIVLSFRKEYQAEIEKELNNFMIPFTKVYLGTLSEQGVIEAIQGINSNEFTKNYFSLNIEPDLPTIIADKIFQDYDYNDISNGPIAPVLQLLLKKMWEGIIDNKERAFTKGLYNRVGGVEGLEDFVMQIIQKVEANQIYQDFVSSGTLHELLFYFVTDRTTAAQHQTQKIPGFGNNTKTAELLNYFQECQLIYSFELDGLQWLRLIHDAIAPVIKRLYERSNFPVQRLSRILQTHLKNQTLLTADELIYFEEWKDWFRILSEEDELLLENCREQHFKSLIKYYIERDEFEYVFSLLLEKNSIKLNDKQHTLVLQVKFQYDTIQKNLMMGLFPLDEYFSSVQQIQKELLQVIDQLIIVEPEWVLNRINNLRIKELLLDKKTDELLKQIETLLKELDEENWLAEVTAINLNLQMVSKMNLYCTISEQDYNLEINSINSALIQLCKKIGKKYQLDTFNTFIYLNNPTKLVPLNEKDKLPIDEISSISKIKEYLDKTREILVEDEVYTAILRLIDLTEKLKAYEFHEPFEGTKKQWINLENRFMLGTTSYNIKRHIETSEIIPHLLRGISKLEDKVIQFNSQDLI